MNSLQEYLMTLKVKVNSDELTNVERKLENLSSYDLIKNNKELSQIIKEQLLLKTKIFQLDDIKNELEQFGLKESKEYLKILEKQKKLKEKLNLYDKTKKSFKEGAKNFFTKEKENISDKMKDTLESVGNLHWEILAKIGNGLKNFFKGIFDELKARIKELPSFNSKGIFYSKENYNQQQEWGFSDAENFAFTKAKQYLNMDDEEYALGGYNAERWEEFQKQFDKYLREFEEMRGSEFIKNVENLQKDFKEFKERLVNELMVFVSENSEEIINLLRVMAKSISLLAELVQGFTNTFSGGTQSEYKTNQNIENIINRAMTNNNYNIVSNRNSYSYSNINNSSKSSQNNLSLLQRGVI